MMEKKKHYVAQQSPNETAALLILHHRYAPTPRVIDLKALLAEPTWKYLGFSHEDAVRGFMRKLEQRWLVARYAMVDRLEQVTTRYSLESLLARRVRV
jgi:HEPN domain-containing protein